MNFTNRLNELLRQRKRPPGTAVYAIGRDGQAPAAMRQHNYVLKIERLYREGKIPTRVLSELFIYHDDPCGIFQGRHCDCDPDIRVHAHKPKT
jgi:hypothetical protein